MATRLYLAQSGTTFNHTYLNNASYSLNLNLGSGTTPGTIKTSGGSSPTYGGPSTTVGPVTYPGIATNLGITDPVSSQVTISSTVTFGFNCYETSMAANAAIGYVVWVIRKDGTWALICDKNYGTEAPTSATSTTTTVTPTSTTLYPGDRIAVAVYADDASGTTMGSGEALWYESGGSNSYVEFAETISFSSLATPTGTVTKLLADASDITGSGKKKLWTDAISAQSSYVVADGSAYTFTQWTETSGGTALEWYTPPLQAATLQGKFIATLRGTSSYSFYSKSKVDVYVTDGDGSNPVLIGTGQHGAAYTTTEADKAVEGIVWGSVSAGQRLKVVVYQYQYGTYAGQSTTLIVESSTSASSITWPATLALDTRTFVPPIVIDTAIDLGMYEVSASFSASVASATMTSSKKIWPGVYSYPHQQAGFVRPVQFGMSSAFYPENLSPSGITWLNVADQSDPGVQGTALRAMSGTYAQGTYLLGGPQQTYLRGTGFMTRPLAEEVTISGNITFNINAYEGDAKQNATVAAIVWRIAADGTWSVVYYGNAGVEVGTTYAVTSWSGTPTSTTFYPGDVIGIGLVHYQLAAQGGPANNDFYLGTGTSTSFVFTEELKFAPEPIGTTLYLSSANSELDTGNGTKKKLALVKSTDGAYITASDTNANLPKQLTLTSGGNTVAWYSDPMDAQSIDGLVRVALNTLRSSTGLYTSVGVKIYKCNADGSGEVHIGSGACLDLPGTANTEQIFNAHIGTTLTTGQRLVVKAFMVYYPHTNNTSTTGMTVTLNVGTSYPTSVVFPRTLKAPQGSIVQVPPIVIDVAETLAWVTQSASIQTSTIALTTQLAAGGSGSIDGVYNRFNNPYNVPGSGSEYERNTWYTAAMDGDTLVLGKPSMAEGSNEYVGSVDIYIRSGDGWAFQQTLTPPSPYNNATRMFGRALAIDGDTLVVSGPWPWYFTGDNGIGRVFVYTRSGSTWSLQQSFVTSSANMYEDYGTDVDIDGDTIVVGYKDVRNIDTGASSGAINVWTRSGGTWTERWTQTKPSGDTSGAGAGNFGGSVAIDNGTIVVGCNGWIDSADGAQGAIFVYTGSGASWTLQQKITYGTGGNTTLLANQKQYYAADGRNGGSLDFSGDLIVGYNYNYTTAWYLQDILLYRRTGSTWSLDKTFSFPTTQEDPLLGYTRGSIQGIILSPTKFLQEFTRWGYVSLNRHWGGFYVWEYSGGTWSKTGFLRHPDYPNYYSTGSEYQGGFGQYVWPDPNNASRYLVFATMSLETYHSYAGSSLESQGVIYNIEPAAFNISMDASPPGNTIYVGTVIPDVSIGGEYNATVALTADVSSSISGGKTTSVTESSEINAVLTADAEVIHVHSVTTSMAVDVSSTVDANTGMVHEATVSFSVDVSSNVSVLYSAGATVRFEAALNPESITADQTIVFGATAFMQAVPYLDFLDSMLHAPPPNDTTETATPASDVGGDWTRQADGQYHYSFEDPSWTDQATYDEDEPGGIQQGTVWWTINVGEISSYEIRGWAENDSSAMQFAVYDSSYNLVASSYDFSTSQPWLQITLRPGTYYIQGWTSVEGGDGLYIDLKRSPITLMSETYNPSADATFSLWGPHLIAVGDNIALATYSEIADDEATPPYSQWHYAKAVAVRVNKEDLTATVGTPLNVWVEDITAEFDIHEILTPFHVGYGVCVIPEWVEAENMGYEGADIGKPIAHVVRVNTTTLGISYLGVLEYSAGYPEAINNDSYFYTGFGDGQGRGVFIGNKYFHWITATADSWSVTTSPVTNVWTDGIIDDFVDYELANGYAWVGNKIITTKMVYEVDWGNTINFVKWHTWDSYTRDGMGHVLDNGSGSVDVLLATFPTGNYSYEYHLRQGVTATDDGTLVRDDNMRWIDSNYFNFYDSDFLIFACKNKWIYSRLDYISPNNGVEKLYYWDGIYQSKYNWNDYMYPRASTYYREFGLGLVGFRNGTFLQMWLGYSADPEDYNERAFFRVGAYPCGEKPLKLAQRDDELIAGAQRIGYDPQNNSVIRIGWVAW